MTNSLKHSVLVLIIFGSILKGQYQNLLSINNFEKKISETESVNQLAKRYNENKITVYFDTLTKGLFGPSYRKFFIPAIVFSKNKQYYTILNSKNTPFDLSNETKNILLIKGFVVINQSRYTIKGIYFLAIDPRYILIPIPIEILDVHKIKPFKLEEKISVTNNAFIINSEEKYFGRTQYQFDEHSENYIKMNSNIITDEFGEITSTYSDLVFSDSGNLIGIMTNDIYCFIIKNLSTNHKLSLDNKIISKKSTKQLRRLKNNFIKNSPIEIR